MHVMYAVVERLTGLARLLYCSELSGYRYTFSILAGRR